LISHFHDEVKTVCDGEFMRVMVVILLEVHDQGPQRKNGMDHALTLWACFVPFHINPHPQIPSEIAGGADHYLLSPLQLQAFFRI